MISRIKSATETIITRVRTVLTCSQLVIDGNHHTHTHSRWTDQVQKYGAHDFRRIGGRAGDLERLWSDPQPCPSIALNPLTFVATRKRTIKQNIKDKRYFVSR
jgi:hypothetical protein